jgi:hypothetical protein
LTGRDPVFYLATSTASHGENRVSPLFRCMFVSGARDTAELRPVYSSLAETTGAAEDAGSGIWHCGIAARLIIVALGRLGSRG